MADELEHATSTLYDATKRREYYLRTRKLKGRKHGSAKPPPHKTRAQLQAEHKRQQEAKVAALKVRLKKLQEVLAAEVKKAQIRSGVAPSKTTSKTSQKSSNSPAQKLTAAQKAKKAKDEKKLREKNKPQSLDEQVKSLNERIKKLLERIAKMHKDGSVGARRNTSK
jgi:HSP90 family molecular chaperone